MGDGKMRIPEAFYHEKTKKARTPFGKYPFIKKEIT
jgi:hypothetical protein